MKKYLYSSPAIGFSLGLLASLIYTIILAAGGYQYTGLAGFFSLLIILVGYFLLSTFWLPTLLKTRYTIALISGITFHTVSSFTLVFMMAGTLPNISELLFPYLTTLVFSFLLMIAIIVAGVILSKVDLTKFFEMSQKKFSIKS
ncbi:hypothetical protein [Guptibacillus hwajinpoensis]|uniref:hypothetical protein n=1 Tax=Guptibacillus hwajinpoensis TaxID=208199 RepID=UPI003D080F32